MSFIQSTIRCKDCGHEMNVAFGIIGYTQQWAWPNACPHCRSKTANFEKIADGWNANKVKRETGTEQP